MTRYLFTRHKWERIIKDFLFLLSCHEFLMKLLISTDIIMADEDEDDDDEEEEV